MTAASKRIASIDVFRAITMLMMLWVNDFAGMSGIAHAFKHAAADEDMLGFSDLVFPAFLFCMGLSIPFAISNRLRKGDSFIQVLLHVIERSVALLIMGVFTMNCSGIEGVMSGQVFKILMVMGFFLLWNQYKEPRTKTATTHRAIGAVILVGLVILRVTHGLPIKTGWWGILGLIGWAYLFSSIIYLITHKSVPAVAVSLVLVYAMTILSRTALPAAAALPGGWTHVGLAMTGVLCGSVMKKYKSHGKDRRFISFAAIMAVACFAAALVCHMFWIISKIQATPTWMFFSLSVSFLLVFVLYLLTDICCLNLRGTFLNTAGTATLTCYLIPTIWYSVQQILSISWPQSVSAGAPGMIKSFVLACVFVLIAWLLGKIHIKLKI